MNVLQMRWCQMCGKEQFTSSKTCSYCGAEFLRDPKPEDGLLARVERAEAMTVRFMNLCVDALESGYYNPIFIDRYNVIYREWQAQK